MSIEREKYLVSQLEIIEVIVRQRGDVELAQLLKGARDWGADMQARAEVAITSRQEVAEYLRTCSTRLKSKGESAAAYALKTCASEIEKGKAP